jgi:glutamate synthase (NADPH/NADH) small chain
LADIRTLTDRKQRLQVPAQPVPKQSPEERVKNWHEVYEGFDLESAKVEAYRCIQCPAAPCTKACPVHNDIPGAFWLLEHGDPIGGANVFRETSTLPEMCGRLCPQERLCEGHCVVGKNNKPVQIGRLEAFLTDYQRQTEGLPKPQVGPATGKRIAIVGAGPAGLAVAEYLRIEGHECTIFDAWPAPGGILLYGIPNFKLMKPILDDKLAYLRELGVQFRQGVRVGSDLSVDELLAGGFDAVFLATGAPLGNELRIPGEELDGVLEATEFLVRGNLPRKLLPQPMQRPLPFAEKVVVIGGGDTSMDCVRTARRLGAQQVTCVYRRTEAEMPGRVEERTHAREEGVRFEFLVIPLEVIDDGQGHAAGVRFQRVALGEPDESGRRRPEPIPGSEFEVEAELVIVAIGYRVDSMLAEQIPGIDLTKWGTLVVDPETMMTGHPGVFAGGDLVNGADLVVTALADAKKAAAAMKAYLAQSEPAEPVEATLLRSARP